MVRAVRDVLIWAVFAAAVCVPLAVAASSPLLAWRDTVYVIAAFAGVATLPLLLAQPLLAAGFLPGLSARLGRQLHRAFGATLVALIAIHVGGLWLTSPPDVVDALLFASPTPFAVWGVIAMWAALAAAVLALLRRRLRPRHWRVAHTALAAVIVTGTVLHAVLIEGTMGTLSKALLCGLVVIATGKVLADRWLPLFRKRQRPVHEARDQP